MTAEGNEPMSKEESNSAVERTSERELVFARAINGPARKVFEAWTRADLFKRWWVPKSFPISLLSCDLDVRIGGGYRLQFGYEGSTMEFFGRYIEVEPNARLVWTNDEATGEGLVTTVTFDERGGKTLVTVHDLYPSKEALDDAVASGSTGISAMPEALEQLEELLTELGAGGER